MTMHTPGPWEIGRMLNPANARAIIGDGDTVVAIMPSEWNGCSYINEDARLIAAAPELLEALQIAVRQNSHDMQMTGEELRICTAAIAKATGAEAWTSSPISHRCGGCPSASSGASCSR